MNDSTGMDADVDGLLEPMEQQEFDGDSPPNRGSGEGISESELKALLDDQETDITVVGCGGAGCNTIDRMVQEGIHGATLVATNTDVQHLVDTEADEKLLIGEDETNGRGAGSLPQIGEKAAVESREALLDEVDGADMVFVTAGMGGGTGTGAAPVVANAAREAGALTVSVVTMPFTSEGEIRRQNAEAGLERLQEVSDTVIVVMNDRLLDAVGKIPVKQAFKVADEILMRSVKGITELVTTAGMVNVDFADVQTVMESGGVAMIGFGESNSDTKDKDAVKAAVQSPLLDVELDGADAALVNVTGGPEMSIDEAEGVVEEIYDRIDPDARIIWGTGVDESLGDTLRAMIVLTGVKSPQISGRAEEPEDPTNIDHVV